MHVERVSHALCLSRTGRTGCAQSFIRQLLFLSSRQSTRHFIVGGATIKCIDELLDAWDWSRYGGHELYTLFYDIKQAYDSVQTEVLVRALHRLHLPVAFIRLIEDSLTGLESCVRTIYGHSRCFPVRRSLLQGD